ncbi:MAG TPA: histone deacetylase [Thermoanaerobaculia bacterium]|nr:histone deacetylase [Thermoanaerobaculia bacterium]
MGRGLRRLAALGQRTAGVHGAHRAELVYSRRYKLELPGVAADPLRADRILAFLAALGLVRPRNVHPPEAASFRQLRRVHTDAYLDALSRPGALVPILGVDLPDPLPDRVLAAQRLMTGGTLAAARLALAGRGGVAASLGGGFHHAFADHGERFCVYNDVAVTVAELRAEGFAAPVLVVDLDLHDGDGTRSIFAADPSVHTFSIHNRTDPRAPAGVASTVVELADEVEDGSYLAAIAERLPDLFSSFRPGLVFYLAGCDPAADDEIGNWKISAQGMLERDRFVVGCARSGERPAPLAILLAGGYGRGAWRYTARFFSWLFGGRAIEPPSSEEMTLARFRGVAASLAPHELTGDDGGRADDWGLTAEDLSAAGGIRARSRFLGYYSRQGLELAFERSGLLDRVRALGFARPHLEMDLDNPGGETLRLYGNAGETELLIELRARIDRRAVAGCDLLRIEWLLLQNPRASFTAERPRLPGQSHPGLGLLHDVLALMILACDRLHLDGLLFVPAHYHSAAQGKRILRFVDPEHEGLFRAVAAALSALTLTAASTAIEEGRVVDRATGQPFRWPPMAMVLPVTGRLKERVEGEDYEIRAAAAAERRAFEVRA